MSKKKILCLLLSSLMLVTTTACSSNDKNEGAKGENKYTPGVYTINTNGMKGEMVVDVTFDETSITDVKVVNHKETYGIGYGLDTTPIETIPGKIVETQSLDVDTVTGATLTSKFLIGAVKQAVTEAGGAPENLADIEDAKGEDQTYDVDVVVVGGGVAGLSAAIEAAEGGADVLVLEKQGIVGGATTRSGGKLMANGTEFQKSEGIEDSNDQMFSYLKEVGGDLIDDEKLSKFVDNSLDTFNWMTEMGVEVQDVEPIHSSLKPWRVHNTKGGGGMTDGHGGQIIVPMMNKYKEVDGDIIYNVTANELLTNDNKEVVGVKATAKDGSTVTVNAKTVILATGGYASNKEMMARYADFTEGYSTQVPAGNVGDGITMAEAVGAQIFDSPSAQTVYVSYTSGVGINEEAGLIVSEDGKRFVNEYTYQYHVGDKMTKENSSLGYYIATANDPTPTVQYAMTLEDTPSAASIEELAELIDLDPATLKATVDRYNELCAKGVDEDFGKPSDKMYPIEGEKYYAIKLNPAVTVTFGGIVTDLESRVLDANNNPIKGLYAAGETAFEGLFGTEYPGCGLAISAGSFYGRIAGQNAANEK
ncbi:FAD-dependent oxidoreductase [Clostridium culturomicium]|uniref:FAD-dependent oxidoreductase n=1 Tax=Clostridium culturomicium TaxID=1499683 RepID=UPI0006932B91|nr:FAD-dependent oxidoreductase [Clostridium culturomicium]